MKRLLALCIALGSLSACAPALPPAPTVAPLSPVILPAMDDRASAADAAELTPRAGMRPRIPG
ncbi:MAG: hypothetical protein H0T44_05215 [Gemmatimonadales bacterium]|nr:hypothetical protein [Gemmatimonadales bacterium]MDQ3426443.1 hypothetical protein [Gemmatimonadota bacterium]